MHHQLFSTNLSLIPGCSTVPTMKSSTLKADLLLLLTALIWGSAFVAQRVGMESMGPMLFTGARFALGALVILPLALRGDKARWRESALWVGGVCAGLVLCAGALLQQTGLVVTTAGKAGFITGLYVVLVPIFGLFLRQKVSGAIWLGVGLAVIGLYLLSVTEDLRLVPGDAIVLAGTVFWALHVILLGQFAHRVATLRLALIQFVVCSLCSLTAAVVMEPISIGALIDGAGPILYGGILSVGIGYTLQVTAQRDALASHAAIILSLEAVFAAVVGWLFLNEHMNTRSLVGCALMLSGMLIAQLVPMRGRLKQKRGLPQGDHPA